MCLHLAFPVSCFSTYRKAKRGWFYRLSCCYVGFKQRMVIVYFRPVGKGHVVFKKRVICVDFGVSGLVFRFTRWV